MATAAERYAGDHCKRLVLYCLPHMVIGDHKTLSPELADGEVPGTLDGLSTKVWIDLELFNDWFVHHFLVYAPSTRPLIHFLEGHSSHYCPDTIKGAAQERLYYLHCHPM